MVHGPEVANGGSAVGLDNEGALAAEIVDQELEECVYREGLVYISYRVEELRCDVGDQTNPGSYGVQRNPIPLSERLCGL